MSPTSEDVGHPSNCKVESTTHVYRDATLGVLLGILLGSVVGIWPFDRASHVGDYVIGASLAAGGLVATMLLSRIGR